MGKEKNNNKAPYFCPVCHSPMGSSLAVAAYRRVQACDMCEDYIYFPNKEKWDSGWRPQVKEARAYLHRGSIFMIDQPEEEKNGIQDSGSSRAAT
jgi:hypothetical protein